MKVRGFYPVTLIIDGEEIVLRIKRMNMEEHSEFKTRFAKVSIPTLTRFVSRKNSGPEQEQNDKGEYKIPFEEIALKRIEELSPEKRAEYETCAREDEEEAKAFLVFVCEQFVTVERGLLEELPDGKEQSITKGIDLLRIFGARQDVIQQILEAVRRENEMDLEQKKTWRSPTALSRSSKGRRRVRVGQKRGTTAKSAATKDSTIKEDANPNQTGRSGSTATSFSSPAPSAD